MQDLSTGRMVSLPDELRESIGLAIPNKEHQGPIFRVGEIMEIRGGMFQVKSIGTHGIVLHGVPSVPSRP